MERIAALMSPTRKAVEKKCVTFHWELVQRLGPSHLRRQGSGLRYCLENVPVTASHGAILLNNYGTKISST
jgi:hypothetical protein